MEEEEKISSHISPRSSFKYAVIGKGLIGSAAAKYIAEEGEDVVLIGADEGEGIHGACYDEARIYRILDHNLNWSKLAKKSIENYSKMRSDTGVFFYKECGILILGQRDNMFVQDTIRTSNDLDVTYTRMNAEGIEQAFPFFQIPTKENIVGLHMSKNAGIFSPRKMLKVQCELARRSGASFVHEHAVKVQPLADKGFEVKMTSGRSIQAEQVLVAAGVFTSLLPLVPAALKLELVCTQTLNVQPDEESLKELEENNMPAIIYEGPTKEDFMFIEPPVEFPDGKKYMKIGSASAFNSPLYGYEQVQAWFDRGLCTEDFKIHAQRLLLRLFPNLKIKSIKDNVCVTDHTTTEQPYIDMLAPGWFVATGGNGWAAKSADQIGYLAAQMMVQPTNWTQDISFEKSCFRAHVEETEENIMTKCQSSSSWCSIS